jgi:pimeloyl-ACP methyl ester carboxylesterase
MAPQIKRIDNLTIFFERPASPKGKPPVLLIHGMFGGAWYWEKYQAICCLTTCSRAGSNSQGVAHS